MHLLLENASHLELKASRGPFGSRFNCSIGAGVPLCLAAFCEGGRRG